MASGSPHGRATPWHLKRAILYFEVERGLRLADVTPKDVRGFVTWLVSKNPKMSRATIERHVATLKAMFGDAVGDNDLTSNPAREIRVAVGQKLTEPDERRALSRDEVKRLLGASPEQWRTQVEFMIHTGMRIGEVVELRWRDIEFAKRSVVKVRRQFANGVVTAPKSGRGVRDIPLSKSLAAALWRLQGAPDELVFTNSVGNRLDKTGFLRNTLRPIAVTAEIDWAVGCHSLRHTCASLLFADGRNVVQVQRWLGHASPDFTLKTYVHLLEDGVGEADFLIDLSPESVRAASTDNGRSGGLGLRLPQ